MKLVAFLKTIHIKDFIQENSKYIIKLLGLLFFFWLLLRNTWCGDDAFISMRVVDNFVNGYGLVWNVGERVQVFTHPFWVLLLIPFYAIIRDPYYSIFLLSNIVSLLVIFLFLFHVCKTQKQTILSILLLSFSTAFIDFSSSGLENPLNHLLLVLVCIIVINKPVSLKTLNQTSFITSLAAITRPDSILFYLPILIYQFYQLRKSFFQALFYSFLGFIPLMVWEIFALYYYGFPFPNTFYAKLSIPDISTNWLHKQGLYYYLNLLRWDALTFFTIVFSIFVTIKEWNPKRLSIMMGMNLYLYYIYSIGGDFMAGRFFSAPFLIASILLITNDYSTLFKSKMKNSFYFLAGIIMIIGFTAKYPPLFAQQQNPETDFEILDGVSNERVFFYDSVNWSKRINHAPLHDWAQQGVDFRATDKRYNSKWGIGFFAYYSGRDVYVLDILTLADPLRARIVPLELFRIAHFPREIPQGYENTVQDGFTNHLVNPDLYYYYEKLDILIHDELNSTVRFREIINMNLGKYDHWIDHYNENIQTQSPH